MIRRWGRTHGPFVTAEPAARFGPATAAQSTPCWTGSSRTARLDRGEFRPEGTEREWCDTDVLRQLRQRSLAALRREVEPADQVTLARFLPAWHGVGVRRRCGLDRLYEVVGQLQGVAVPASVLERDVLAARVRGYTPRLLDELLAAGEVVWVGAGPLGRDDGRVVLLAAIGCGPARAGSRPASRRTSPSTTTCGRCSAGGELFLPRAGRLG